MTIEQYRIQRFFILSNIQQMRLSLKSRRYNMFYGSEARRIIKDKQIALVRIRSLVA